MGAQPVVDRAHVLAAHPPGRGQEAEAERNAGHRQQDHQVGARREHAQCAAEDAGDDGGAREGEVVQQQLQLGGHLGRERAAQDLLCRVVDSGLQAVADHEEEHGRVQARHHSHRQEAGHGRGGQGQDHILDARPVEQEGRDPQRQHQLHEVADQPGVADQNAEIA